jgi:Zn-dependent alcohol dehydrogenase
MHARGQAVSVMACLGTFSQYTVVNQMSCVKIERDVPLELACLIGCGVTTGWGSAVYAADVRPGDSVAVIGIGGIGAAALQGARLAGAERIFAIDPVPLKRELASRFGATTPAIRSTRPSTSSSRRPSAACATRSSAQWALDEVI